MSMFVKHEARPSRGAGLALLLGLVWLGTLGAIWYTYRSGDAEAGGILHFIARFHVVVVHLPIGVIFLALLMELVSLVPGCSHLRRSMPFVLWIAVLGGIGATVIGYLLMNVEGFGGRAVERHMWFGLAVVACTLLALVLLLRNHRWFYRLALVAASLATAASGHFGGAMVHEADYLTEHAPESLKPVLLAGLGASDEEKGEPESGAEGDTDEAEKPEVPLAERVVYTDFVAPILDAKCNKCHDANKTKGDLRMDTYEKLIAGAEGSDFPTVVPGNADGSELIVRVTLPEDDIDFMPPKGDPLTSEEMELISLWIQSGAGVETTVAELGDAPSIEDTALAVAALHDEKDEDAGKETAVARSVWDTLAPGEREKRMDEVMAAARRYNFSVMPVSAEDERLRVNVINAADEFGDEQLALLEPVADRIAWLDLARSQVTDEGMEVVGRMTALERLHLENTEVTDAGIAKLAGLTELEYLNLYGTDVGNGIFETFRNMPKLRKVYVWQTNVDAKRAAAYERSVNLQINTGVALAASSAGQSDDPAEGQGAGGEGNSKSKNEEKKPDQSENESKPKKKPEPADAGKAKTGNDDDDSKPAGKAAAKPGEKKGADQTQAKPAKKPKPGAKKDDEPEKSVGKDDKADAPPKPKGDDGKNEV